MQGLDLRANEEEAAQGRVQRVRCPRTADTPLSTPPRRALRRPTQTTSLPKTLTHQKT